MKIVVLAGGTSTERDVSLSSGVMIYRALKSKGHKAILLDVYLGYQWEEGKQDNIVSIFEKERDWAGELGSISEQKPDIDQVKAMRPDGDKNFFGPNVIRLCQASDAVFMALHGENGENGKIQACFDLMGITYTGTDYVSSALAMDKGISKELFVYHGIPTPAYIRFQKGQEEKETISFPCIVKACCGGSSVGVSIARTKEEYESALAEAFRYDDEVIVEQYIDGREFSVGVMEGKALPVIEIAPLEGFYNYKNKYQPGATVETCPAQLPVEKTGEIQKYAEKAFTALRLKNYARMDFMMNRDGEVFCLEANTLPGMTPTSLLPQEAAALGMSFDELCERILKAAVR
ncbi:D-alanine--D-alanine ligase family protein [Parablautia muri]|uniref:D-alanine--D-alanine ligase n=1 Tax=Parablautia muri TaxID=2320879 RepID=A0A9X5BDM1_9FIRM|nr:D-alanine--D-alanine ligase [Parablautia muri]NBJ91905.1 D-alanine--D-alanine ligase [Parablautia muri]